VDALASGKQLQWSCSSPI